MASRAPRHLAGALESHPDTHRCPEQLFSGDESRLRVEVEESQRPGGVAGPRRGGRTQAGWRGPRPELRGPRRLPEAPRRPEWGRTPVSRRPAAGLIMTPVVYHCATSLCGRRLARAPRTHRQRRGARRRGGRGRP